MIIILQRLSNYVAFFRFQGYIVIDKELLIKVSYRRKELTAKTPRTGRKQKVVIEVSRRRKKVEVSNRIQ